MNGIHEWIEEKNIHNENYDQFFYIITKSNISIILQNI